VTRVLGIDPGTKYFAWALLEDGKLTSVGFRGASDVRGLPQADLLVIELPKAYASPKVRRKDISALSVATGEIAALYRALVHALYAIG